MLLMLRRMVLRKERRRLVQGRTLWLRILASRKYRMRLKSFISQRIEPLGKT